MILSLSELSIYLLACRACLSLVPFSFTSILLLYCCPQAVDENTMPQNEYDYRELQEINEHLRRENHLLRLLDELQRESRDAGTSTSVPVSGSQDTPVEGTGTRSAGTESQGTLGGEVDQKMDVDAHCDKSDDEHRHPEEEEEDKEEEEEEEEGDDEEGEEEEEKEKGKEKEDEEEKEEEEEENSQYDDSNASDAQSESTCLSNCTDEDSKDQDEDEGIPEEQLIRELHGCNPRAHRNAVLSLYKRDVCQLGTVADDLHIKRHQDLKDCPVLSGLTVGLCKLDASLYMASESNPYKRTDVWVYRKLYGLHPALVMWIGKFCPLPPPFPVLKFLLT